METIFISIDDYLKHKGELHGGESIYFGVTRTFVGIFKSYDLEDFDYIIIENEQGERLKKSRRYSYVEIEVQPIYVAI